MLKKEVSMDIPAIQIEKQDSTLQNNDEKAEIPKVYFNTNDINFDKIKIKSKIEIKSSKFSQSIPVNVNIKKDSLIWISVSLGLEAARAIINPDTMYLLDRLNKNSYKISFKELSNQFNFEINFKMIQALLVGNMPIELDSTDGFYNKPEFNLIVQNRKNIEIDNRFDLNLNKLFSISGKDKKTSTLLKVNFMSFVSVDGYTVPRLTFMSFENNSDSEPKAVNIEIENYKYDFLDRNLRFPFSIPKGYTEMPIPKF